jgi:hypothetical protein
MTDVAGVAALDKPPAGVVVSNADPDEPRRTW